MPERRSPLRSAEKVRHLTAEQLGVGKSPVSPSEADAAGTPPLSWPETLRWIGDHLEDGDDEDRKLYHDAADHITKLEAVAEAARRWSVSQKGCESEHEALDELWSAVDALREGE